MASTSWSEMAPGYDIRPAWRLDDARIEADATAFWRRLDILPPDVTPEVRAKELGAVAYKDGRIVGVTTAGIVRLEQVRARLAMLRGAVDPEHRRSYLAQALALYTRELVERWSMAHPEEKVAGLGAIIESPDLVARQKQPFWPMTRLGLIGFTADGRQIRVSWFVDFRLD
jgi:hypothetical protein